MAVDLGRAQGASIFHTMAASGTNVAISSLQPQGLTPFIGDAVQFPNSDVRQITEVGGSTITLGEVLFSYKGDPGIGNAVLSNIDGNSTENGFTQSAVKGVAQSKNYYNEGSYDTSVSNGDSTGTVTRKTETEYFNGGEDERWYYDSKFGGRFYITLKVVSISTIGSTSEHFKTNRNGLFVFNTASVNMGFYAQDKVLYIRYDEAGGDVAKFKTWLSQHPLVVQYETQNSYIEEVIDNQPIRLLPLAGELWLDDEWQKGLNLFDGNTISNINVAFINGGATQIQADTNNTPYYKAQGFESASGSYVKNLFPSGSVKIGVVGGTFTKTNDFNFIRFGIGGTVRDTTIGIDVSNLINGKTYSLYWNFTNVTQGSVSWTDIMLNEGNHPYPFEPYYGGLLRERDMPLYTTTDSTSPAGKLGGDWESKGNYTTSDGTVIYVWRKL